MKFPLITMTKSLTTRFVLLALASIAMTLSISAQKGSRSLAPEAVGYRLEQCANGKRQTPNVQDPCDTGNEWITGIVNSSKAHYIEGDSVPYRLIIDGLAPGVPTFVTFSYDSTKGGPHAIDYITSYDRTENASNPNGASQAIVCAGLTGDAAAICNVADLNGDDQEQIPLDPNYSGGFPTTPNFPQDNVGEFITIWGGTIDGLGRRTSCTDNTPIPNVNPYLLCGDPAGTSTTDVTVFFTPTTTAVVLAWGGHIARRADWGINGGATSISGAPFHTGMITGGSRDVQMSLDAVLFPGQIKIVKEVFTINPPGGTASTFQFNFTSSANSGLGSFFLVDDDGGPGSDNVVNSNIQTFYVNGNTATEITVTEANYANAPHPWTVSGMRCAEQSGGSQLPQMNDSFPQPGTILTPAQLAARQVTIRLQEGEFVTCTFSNTESLAPSAAGASISGRVVTAFGAGIGGARLTVLDPQNGNVYTAISNPFGYYEIPDVEIDNFYIMTISHKRYTFADDMRTFTLHDNVTGFDFIANPE